MIKETPAAIEKNATREEKSRMVGKEVKSTLQHKPDPTTCSLLFAIIRWPVPKKKRPLQPKGTPRIFPRGSYPADAHVGKPLSQRGNAAECTFAQVNDAVAVVRPVVVDLDHHAATIGLIRHPHAAAEWQASVRCCHGLRVEAFAASSEITVEAWSVEAGGSA